jgi:thiol-disulfide isomerase/thioredoxin
MSQIENNTTPMPVPEPSDSPGRRNLLLGAAGLTAAVLGAGIAWWRTSDVSHVTAGDPVPEGFWELQWDAPQGDPVQMQSFRGKPLLINFWATWCTPCVEEMPAINDFYKKNKPNGMQVLGLAVDKASAVTSFLQKMQVAYPIGMAGANGTDWAGRLGNPSGALPYSVLLGGNGQILQRKLGKLSSADLAGWGQLK